MAYTDIVKEVGRYYTEKFKEYSDGPHAVDWNSKEAQHVRFAQLSRILPKDNTTKFSLCDFGCGLGDYQIYLENDYSMLEYTGIDVSTEIIDRANQVRGGWSLYM